MKKQSKQKIGLIAGNGRFPLIFSKAASEHGYEVIAFAVIGETFEELTQYVNKIFWYDIGKLDFIIKAIKEVGITEIVMAGKITKTKMFGKLKLDQRWYKLLARLRNRNDDSLLGAIVEELELEGIKVMDSTMFLSSFLPEPGVLTKRSPDEKELIDIEYGKKIAKEVAGLDIGQTVVVKNRAILAVEAIEGTDQAILRGGRLGKGDIVVVKVSKPKQDMRFDIPVIGLNTIRNLIDVRAKALVIESGKTLFLDREKVIRLANENDISVVVF